MWNPALSSGVPITQRNRREEVKSEK